MATRKFQHARCDMGPLMNWYLLGLNLICWCFLPRWYSWHKRHDRQIVSISFIILGKQHDSMANTRVSYPLVWFMNLLQNFVANRFRNYNFLWKGLHFPGQYYYDNTSKHAIAGIFLDTIRTTLICKFFGVLRTGSHRVSSRIDPW